MQEPQTWRMVLGTLIKDSQQRQKLADELGVAPATLTRWVRKQGNPRLESLHRLLNIFPEQRALLLPLIAQEFPAISSHASGGDELPEEIPSAFYHQILSMLCTLPQSQVVWATCELILCHALDYLDPSHRNVAVLITQCVPPSAGNKVRSVRSVMGVGRTPWGGNPKDQTIFLGAETVPGRVVSLGLPILVQDYQHPRQTGPESRIGIRSSCTYPLLYANHILGTFGAISIVPEYFLPSRQRLIQQYATFVSGVFSSEASYALQDIELRIMPAAQIQLPYLHTLRSRIQQVMRETMERGQPMTSMQAEQLVWQQLEEELLQVALLKQ